LVFGQEIPQYYQLNMEGEPDANLSFSVKKGFCGEVFRSGTQRAKFRDLRALSAEEQSAEFNFGKRELARISHVKAVACAALYKEGKTFRGAIKQKYFGVLNVDATDDLGAEYLADPEVLNQVAFMAKFVQVTFPG
jgi:hypothetical protein